MALPACIPGSIFVPLEIQGQTSISNNIHHIYTHDILVRRHYLLQYCNLRWWWS